MIKRFNGEKLKNIIVFRTNKYYPQWQSILKDLSKSFKVIIVCDESNGNVDYSDINKIPFSKIEVKKIGLKDFEGMQWRCGDYAIYLAHSSLTDYDNIWLIEPDVYFNKSSLSNLIKNTESIDDDLLVTYFSESESTWYWNKFACDLNVGKPYKCFFPLLRISKSAVEYLLEKRRELESLANDESFVATVLANSKFSISEFRNVTSINYSMNTFSYKYPHLSSLIKNNKWDIYHPCFYNKSEYFRHLFHKGSWKNYFKKIINYKTDTF